MIDDVELPNRWYLKSPRDGRGRPIDPESFRRATSVSLVAPLALATRRDGTPLDFTFADFDMPVVSVRTLEILSAVALQMFQAFRARVDGYSGEYAIVNFLRVCACLDESKSEFIKWTKADNRADKIGQYRQISRLVIDPVPARNLDVFRLDGWRIALLVSERIQQAFVEGKVTGVRFMPAC